MSTVSWLARGTIALLGVAVQVASAADDRAAERERMVREQIAARHSGGGRSSAPPPSLSGDARAPVVGTTRDFDHHLRVRNPRVLDAMRKVPRHWFVPEKMQAQAYADRPLPIGYGQTISQPYIVALMTELLDPQPNWKVLEVGTGSGYQAAILKELTPDVYTIEIIGALQEQAQERLQRLGLDAGHVIHGDGYFGLPKVAPFDGIIVTAAADHIPPPLLQQLKPGGRMVIPIGPVHSTQRLVVVTKDENGKVRSRTILPVRFVPLTGGPREQEKK